MLTSFIKGFVKGYLLVLLWTARVFCTPCTVLLGLLSLTPFLFTALLIYLWDWCNDEEGLKFPFTLAFGFPVFLMLSGTCSLNLVNKWGEYCNDR